MADDTASVADEERPKRLVLDANILVRAMLGSRVRKLIEDYITVCRVLLPCDLFPGCT